MIIHQSIVTNWQRVGVGIGIRLWLWTRARRGWHFSCGAGACAARPGCVRGRVGFARCRGVVVDSGLRVRVSSHQRARLPVTVFYVSSLDRPFLVARWFWGFCDCASNKSWRDFRTCSEEKEHELRQLQLDEDVLKDMEARKEKFTPMKTK